MLQVNTLQQAIKLKLGEILGDDKTVEILSKNATMSVTNNGNDINIRLLVAKEEIYAKKVSGSLYGVPENYKELVIAGLKKILSANLMAPTLVKSLCGTALTNTAEKSMKTILDEELDKVNQFLNGTLKTTSGTLLKSTIYNLTCQMSDNKAVSVGLVVKAGKIIKGASDITRMASFNDEYAKDIRLFAAKLEKRFEDLGLTTDSTTKQDSERLRASFNELTVDSTVEKIDSCYTLLMAASVKIDYLL